MTDQERRKLDIQTPEQQDASILSASDAAAMLGLKLTLVKLLEKGDERGAAAVVYAMDAIRMKPEYNGKYDQQDKGGNYSTNRKTSALDRDITIRVDVSTGKAQNVGEQIAMYIADSLGALPFGVAWSVFWGLYKAGINPNAHLSDALAAFESALMGEQTKYGIGGNHHGHGRHCRNDKIYRVSS